MSVLCGDPRLSPRGPLSDSSAGHERATLREISGTHKDQVNRHVEHSDLVEALREELEKLKAENKALKSFQEQDFLAQAQLSVSICRSHEDAIAASDEVWAKLERAYVDINEMEVCVHFRSPRPDC